MSNTNDKNVRRDKQFEITTGIEQPSDTSSDSNDTPKNVSRKTNYQKQINKSYDDIDFEAVTKVKAKKLSQKQ